MRRRPIKFVRGFTLVELLTVICIIVVLISMLLPAFVRARDTLRQTQCANNMRMIGHAFVMYVADNQGGMPVTAGNGWVSYNWLFWQSGRNINGSALQPYLALKDSALADMFRCPAQPVENQQGFQGGGSYPYTYTMNGWMIWHTGAKYAQIKNPVRKIMLYDENENADDDIFWYGTGRDTLAGRHGSYTFQVAQPNGVNTLATRRFGNVTYYDGHVDLATNDMCHTPAYNDPTLP